MSNTEKCETCGGTGLLDVERDEYELQIGSQESFCPTCDGSGTTDPHVTKAVKVLIKRAHDLAEDDPSRTWVEWLDWLLTQLVGDQPPVEIVG
jgi:hypothetical protein